MIVVPVKFYPPKVVAKMYDMDQKLVIKNAILAGSLYQIGNRRLINLYKMDNFFRSIQGFSATSESKYCQVNEAIKKLGIPERSLLQLASDADALRKVGRLVLVNTDKVVEYIEGINSKVEIFAVDECASLKRSRRYKELCLR